MKKYIKFAALTAVAVAGAFSFSACDNIDEEDRFIPVERPTVERVVLVQEFTGQSCVNCPNGAATIHALQENFPGSVIAVCFHPEGTPFTAPVGPNLGLTAPQATEYFNYYRPNGFPAAMINGGKLLYNIDEWSSAVSSALSTPSPADIELSCSINEQTRELTANWNVKFNQMYSNKCSVLLWVMENGIIGPQLSSTQGVIVEYSHNHVFRQSLNGLWGEELGDSFATEQTVSGSSTITLKDSWKAENLQVVAFIFQTDSKKVEQATLWPAE